MKKVLCCLLAVCMCLSFLPGAYAARDDAVTVDASWCVLIPEEPTDYERFTAGKLQTELSKVFGEEIAVTSSADENYIAVGGASALDVTEIADNGYRIAVLGGNVHMNGTGVRGLQIAAYRFLEQFCGRKAYTSDLTVLPQAESIAVPADTDIVYEPFFEYTDTDWLSPHDAEYSMANGLTGGANRSFPTEMGVAVNYIGGFCHTMGGLCETETHAETDPEQLALHGGERTADQPCLTNPEVLRIATENVMKILEERHDPDATLQIVSVTQNDNMNYCECEACKAFEAAHGGVQSATMINFANQIADAVKEAGYENVAIDTFAYQYTRQAPTGIVPRDNVIVRLCSIECCFRHTLDDPECENNVALMKDLADWAEICDRLYIWDYTTNYRNTCIIFPDFGVIQRNIQVFYENSVKGYYAEGNYYIWNCDAEFGELRAYMLAKCMQDPYCDLEPEIDGFLDAYYGPGGENIKEIIVRHVDNAGSGGSGHVGIGEGPSQSFSFTDREVAAIDALWETAKAAAEDETQTEHIERSELSWRFWKASVNKGEFSLWNMHRYDEKVRLFEDLQAFGVTMISEGGYDDYLDCICIKYAPANEWDMYEAGEPGAEARLFFGKILEKLMPLLTACGIVYKMLQMINAPREA